MNKYRIKMQLDVLATGEVEAAARVQNSFANSYDISNLIVTGNEKMMTPVETLEFWRDNFRKEKSTERNVFDYELPRACPVEYFDAAVAAFHAQAIGQSELYDVWQEVKKDLL